VFEPSQGSYRSAAFFTKKKDGSLRHVIDLQPLNAITIRDAGLPPAIDAFVEPFAGFSVYSSFDLFSGYDARIIHPKSRDLTSFQTPLGLVRNRTLPMGYTNAVAEFQNCTVFILQDEIPHNVGVMIDDLGIKGPRSRYMLEDGSYETIPENSGIRRFIWEHAVTVNRVLHRVKHAGATISPKKSQVARGEIILAGQKLTFEGHLPDDSRVSKIIKWPPCQNIRDVRGFLGVCGTVRIWIQDYSRLARPLTELTRKDTEFIWDERRQAAMDILKEAVVNSPALISIDYESDRPVIFAVDTSNIAIGFVIYQLDEEGRRRPVRFGSLPINERESRYSQSKLELFGLYRALRHSRYQLFGVKNLIVEVDASYIRQMINNPDFAPNATLNRWIAGILLFDFRLVHVPAVKHVAPDGLSRRIPAEDDTVVDDDEEDDDDEWFQEMFMILQMDLDGSEFPSTPTLRKGWTFAQTKSRRYNDQIIFQIFKFLSNLIIPSELSPNQWQNFLAKASNFYLEEDKMW
jgi:RNase H-like domain found in reverse transcriptase